MNVLSLFDGMSCGRIALERAGIPVDAYYASEVDKYAIKVSGHNYPDIVQLGDVTKWKEWNIDWSSIDLLIGGSPCQSFSNSGEKLGFDDPRGQLLLCYLEIRDHILSLNPKLKWFIENVPMKSEHLNKFNEYVGASPVVINSSLVSALHRKRLYWCNWSFDLPEDRCIYLKDILVKYATNWLTDKAINRLDVINKRAKEKGLGYKDCILTGDDKYLNLDANYFKGADGKRGVINQNGRLRMLTPVECERLQCVKDGYTDCVSNTQRYKMLGNGWTVDVVAHIFENLLENND